LTSGFSSVIAEVKTIVGKKRHESGGYDPCKPIVRKLKKARPQLAESEDEPHCVVLHSQSSIDSLDPSTVACAAFGPGFQQIRPNYFVIDGSPPILRFSRKSELPHHLGHLANAVLSPVINRRISALVILASYALSDFHLAIWRQLVDRQDAGENIPSGESMRILSEQQDRLPHSVRHEGTIRAIVLENPYARATFPPEFFRGPFDQRWSAHGEGYGPVWIGDTLGELQADGTPFHML
jgi:hypothetical protein